MNKKKIDNTLIDSVLSYIPYFTNLSNEFARFKEPDVTKDPNTGNKHYTIHGYRYSVDTIQFIQKLQDAEIVFGFDWMNWSDESNKYFKNKELIEKTDLETIKKLFTTCVRADRFNEGYLAHRIEDGVILCLLLRLKKIYAN